ncbi:MAG: ATP-binding protein [Methanophagales archaeon]|nr:ATP-binding protein [Methanophagales archaeon]
MSTKFVDREDELKFLERKYEDKSAQLIIIYGRRRVGKTELMKKFFRGKIQRRFYLLNANGRIRRLALRSMMN